MSTTWWVDVRILRKDGKFVEYKGEVTAPDNATAANVEKHILGRLINHSPDFKGGRVTNRLVRKMPK